MKRWSVKGESEIGVHPFFLANRGRGAVAWEHAHLFGQGHHLLAERAHQGLHIATRQVAAADGSLEQAVATEQHAVCFFVEANAAGRMAGRIDNAQRMGAETDLVALVQHPPRGRHLEGEGTMEEGRHLLLGRLVRGPLIAAHFGQEVVAAGQVVEAEDVVEMAMRDEQMDKAQVVFGNKRIDIRTLFGVESTVVHEHGFARCVPEQVAVLLYHIDLEGYALQAAVGLRQLYGSGIGSGL